MIEILDEDNLPNEIKFLEVDESYKTEESNGLKKYSLVDNKKERKSNLKISEEDFFKSMRTIRNYHCQHKHFNYETY